MNFTATMIKKAIFAVLLCLAFIALFVGCNTIDDANGDTDNNTNDTEKKTMSFTFEAIQDLELMSGSSYFMDFGDTGSQGKAAIIEGKLLTAFGAPATVSENYENSFNYIIRATADNGETLILTVYGMGVVHIGSERKDSFAEEAANALIEYVNSAEPMDYQRTVYYLDYDLQLDISVKDGVANISKSQISQDKADELFEKWYG